jgi:DNA polymerase-3 subunit delta
MIFKYFETQKIKIEESNFVLLYGKNTGLKNETVLKISKNIGQISNYDEREILENSNNFLENILSRSLFESEKIIVIKRATDKILSIIKELNDRNYDGIIIIDSNILEKKSKLRSFFEKDKKYVCVAFYPDTDQILAKLCYDFLKNKNISISQSNINLIVNQCNGDRETLINELKKIE